MFLKKIIYYFLIIYLISAFVKNVNSEKTENNFYVSQISEESNLIKNENNFKPEKTSKNSIFQDYYRSIWFYMLMCKDRTASTFSKYMNFYIIGSILSILIYMAKQIVMSA